VLSTVDARLLSRFLRDPMLLTRVKIENYLLIDLGVRPCSQTTLPAELPNSQAMGSAIERIMSPRMGLLQRETDPRRRMAAIKALRKAMSDAYDKVVEGSEECRSHISWAKSFRLRNKVVEVRPTIRELYLFRDKETERMLDKLMKERQRLKERAYARASPETEKIHLAYPEEFEGSWLREMGRTLGYPDCCVKAYASNRERGINVEKRAARQIEDMGQHDGVDPFSYFVGYFFPCTPNCEEASSLGRESQRLLSDLDNSLGELYKTLVAENLERVKHQPELLAKHRARAEEYVRRYR
jgi:hypothetical protein